MAGYDAFISYSHQADGDLAPALEAGLQRLGKPWNQRRAMEVFLDQQDLSASPHLWSSIVVALDQSDWFVVLASPGSAGSKWVGQEIAHWLSVPERRDRLLIVLTSWRLQWADGDFTDDSDAANPALRGVFDEEPLYVDMTQLDRALALDLRNPLFKERVATLAATVRRTSVGDLIGEDTRQYLLARRLRRIAVVSLAALTVGAVIASVVALQQRSEAQTQRVEAESQRNEALRQKAEAETQKAAAEKNAAESRARELAATALDTMSDDPVLATLIAVEANYPNGAVEPVDVPEARTTLGVTLRNVQGATLLKVGPRITAPTTDILRADSQFLVTVNMANGTRDLSGDLIPPTWWDTETGVPVAAPVSDAEVQRMMAPLGDVVSSGSAISLTPVVLGATPVTEPFDVDDAYSTVVGLDASAGDLVVESMIDGTVSARLAVPEGATLAQVELLSPSLVVARTHQGDALVWDVVPGAPPRRLDVEMFLESIAAIDDHRIVATGYSSFTDPVTGEITSNFDTPVTYLFDVTQQGVDAFVGGLATSEFTQEGSLRASPDGALLAAITVGDGLSQPVVVWDLDSGEEVATIDAAQAADIRWVDRTTIAIASTRGVEQYRLRPAAEVVRGDFAALATTGAEVALRDYRAGSVAVVSGSLSASGLPRGGVGEGVVDSPQPGSVALSPDGSLVAALQYEQLPGSFVPVPSGVTVTTRDDRRVLATFPDARGVAFDSTGGLLAVGGENSVQIVDTSNWTVGRTLPVEGYTPEQLLWTKGDRNLIANGVDQTLGGARHLEVIDAGDGGRMASGPAGVAGMALSPDGSVLAIGLEGGEVRLLHLADDGTLADVPVGVMVADLSRVRGLSFSPDGARLATSGVRSTIIWDVRTPSAPRQVQVVSDLPAWTFGGVLESDVVGVPKAAKGTWGLVAFRPDGTSLVLAGGSGAVELPDFDPVLACKQATAADLGRLEQVLGEPGACTRVPALNG